MGQTKIKVSEPIVPFLETIVPDTQLSQAKIFTTHTTVNIFTIFGFNFLGMFFKTI